MMESGEEGEAAVALTREQIVDAALSILTSYGLADLSMRRLAKELEVQPGALYWHVKNKQELLTVLAERILAPVTVAGGPDLRAGARQAAQDIRAALLAVPGAADVVALAQVLRPELLLPLRDLEAMLAAGPLTGQQARWGARTLIHYILGTVAEEQTHAELAQAGLLPAGKDDGEAFLFGVDTVLAGLLPGPVGGSRPAS
ncbi:TetR family transcriptional regulator [Arthrobacter sp. I2-34]|uniref:TetR family transcriptional regulator n=1 Tax=Arthrobacter hankyongi TaxID=2904801 RepID=A0ABS9L4R3_9MICC|nr:TetR family transcriptional regulator [Arthrobacter hankyongi]MCG2621464.1 TetR family transcriptional regulator [Arthrobacter hankyongi]